MSQKVKIVQANYTQYYELKIHTIKQADINFMVDFFPFSFLKFFKEIVENAKYM